MSEGPGSALRAVDTTAVDAEITDVLGESDPNWEFALALWVRYEHPGLRTFSIDHRFRARPTEPGGVDEPGQLHEAQEWWFADGKPLQGTAPFHTRPLRAHDHAVDVDDDDALWGFAHEVVMVDPAETLDALLFEYEDDPAMARRLLAKGNENGL